MALLSQAFTIAVQEWEWLDNNPMHKVRKPSLPQPRARFLSDRERARLLDACKSSPCHLLYPVVVVALATGARYSEVMNLTWQQVDLDRGVARLETTKNKERRTLPLAHHALEVMKAHHEREGFPQEGWVFPREDGQAPMEIRKHWEAALDAADVRNFRFHDLRHSAASYLAMNGASLAEIAEVLGHKTLQMVKRYAHLSDAHIVDVVARMNKKIFDADGS
jgi:integrase